MQNEKRLAQTVTSSEVPFLNVTLCMTGVFWTTTKKPTAPTSLKLVKRSASRVEWEPLRGPFTNKQHQLHQHIQRGTFMVLCEWGHDSVNIIGKQQSHIHCSSQPVLRYSLCVYTIKSIVNLNKEYYIANLHDLKLK